MADIPSLTSGRRSIKDPVVENLNVLIAGIPLRYLYIKDGLKVGGRVTRHDIEGEGVNLGFDVRSGGVKEGPLDLQLNYPTDALPIAAHVIKLTKGAVVEYYGVTDLPTPNERNNVIRVSPALFQIINPLFQGLLSADLGDSFQQTYSVATMATTETLDPKPVNTRAAATKAYSAVQADGSALPVGITISSTTGVLSFVKATVVIGTYVIKVIGSDILATLPSDHPYRQLDCEQTLLLTITA